MDGMWYGRQPGWYDTGMQLNGLVDTDTALKVFRYCLSGLKTMR